MFSRLCNPHWSLQMLSTIYKCVGNFLSCSCHFVWLPGFITHCSIPVQSSDQPISKSSPTLAWSWAVFKTTALSCALASAQLVILTVKTCIMMYTLLPGVHFLICISQTEPWQSHKFSGLWTLRQTSFYKIVYQRFNTLLRLLTLIIEPSKLLIRTWCLSTGKAFMDYCCIIINSLRYYLHWTWGV